jgi:hypothetical protein
MNKTKTIICLSVASVVFLVTTPFVFICSKKANTPYTSSYHFSEQYGYFIDAMKEVPDDGGSEILLKLEAPAKDATSAKWQLSFSAERTKPEQFTIKVTKDDGTKSFKSWLYFSSNYNYSGFYGCQGSLEYVDSARPSSDYGSGHFELTYDGVLSLNYIDNNHTLSSYYESLVADDFLIISEALKYEAVTMNGKAFLLERATSVRDYRESLAQETAEKSAEATAAALCLASAAASLVFGLVVTIKWVKHIKHPNA